MIKNCNLPSTSKLQKKPSALKRGHPTLQNMNLKKIFYFCGSFLPSWIRIGIPNPDPVTRLNPDPDPQPCLEAGIVCWSPPNPNWNTWKGSNIDDGEKGTYLLIYSFFYILTNFPSLLHTYIWYRQTLMLPGQCCGSVSCWCRSSSGSDFPFLRPIRIRIRPQVLLMLENVGKYEFFLHFVTFIRRHRVIILNIMDIIVNFLEKCIVYYIWLKKKIDTDPYWQALDADPDQDQPLPQLCRSDRIRIHNTGNWYKCRNL